MQKITIKEITTKDGETGGRGWTLTNIIGTDGTKFGCFNPNIAKLRAGDIIEAEIEVKGNKTNINEWKLISAANKPPEPQTQSNGKMTPEQWAEKDRMERESIEAQVAFKGIIDMAKTIPSFDPNTKFKKAYNLALDWSIKKLGGNPKDNLPTDKPPEKTTPEPAKPEAEKPVEKTEGRDPKTIKTIEELQKALKADFGLTLGQQLDELNLKYWSDLKMTPDKAYDYVASTRR